MMPAIIFVLPSVQGLKLKKTQHIFALKKDNFFAFAFYEKQLLLSLWLFEY